MSESVVIFGTGLIAELSHFYFETDSNYKVVAFTVDREYCTQKEFCGLPVVPFEEVQTIYPPSSHAFFVAVSYNQMNQTRASKFESARVMGYKLISYISSKATVFSNVQIGDNCFVLEDNTIQPFAKIGNNCTLWSGNHIGHHSIIQDHCFISSHVVISGGVTVEPYCFIGVNATIRDNITIARNNLIGAGTLILKSTQPEQVFSARGTEPASIPSSKIRAI